mgnify:CR=1 FL=1
MNNQEILDNAPEGATNADNDGGYWLISSQDKPQAYFYGSWSYCEPREDIRSLEDIRHIVELENKNAKMLECLCDISDACIGKLTMSYSLDAEGIGQSIYEATGMTNPQLNASLKEHVKL